MGKSDDLQAYLASKYMTGAKADAILDRAGDESGKRRKKKRKVDSVSASAAVVSGGGIIIADEDDMDWARRKEEEDEEARPGEWSALELDLCSSELTSAAHCSRRGTPWSFQGQS